MFQRTTAVCLHKVDFSETSQVLRFFTPDSGKINEPWDREFLA